VKALIEPPESILWGELRRRIPIPRMKQLRAIGGQLRFQFEGDAVGLDLGETLAAKWVKVSLLHSCACSGPATLTALRFVKRKVK
jgi:hypothetical protein